MTMTTRNTVEVAVYYNYRTGQADALFGAPEDWSDYLPQQAAVQGIYQTYLDMGRTPAEAARLTLDRYSKRQEELRNA
jgi:hypothetical protein